MAAGALDVAPSLIRSNAGQVTNAPKNGHKSLMAGSLIIYGASIFGYIRYLTKMDISNGLYIVWSQIC